jgi:transposase
VAVPHPSLKPGDACPECPKGKVYAQKDPRPLVRIVGQSPLAATVYNLEELRCNACGQVFTAPEPEGVGPEKYDETALAMVAELKYGSGMPLNRIENLEERLGVPLPASDERTGVFTSAVLSVVRQEAGPEGAPEGNGERRMALYFSGREHAGENLAKVLKQRAAENSQAMLMSDALSRNAPKLSAGVELLLANCLAHGRRQFVEVAGSFPAECRYVLETLGGVYANDAVTKEEKMTPVARLEFHRQHSQTPMDELENWMREQFSQRKVFRPGLREPNSGLGKAITYMQRHWKALTLFLRQPGAPLDNNICERALKLAVLHRKNALFYRTLNGAQVGDLFMSLIHTCQLNGVNSFEYLVELLRHASEVAASPREWMPWCYRDHLGSG